MGNPTQRQRRQIGQNLSGSPIVEPSGASRTASSRDNLKVDQLRSGQPLPAKALADAVAVSTIIRKRGREH